MLALFCYRRSHLHALAVTIAASCSERELVLLGGRVGSALYALSRETSRAVVSSAYGHRKPITLSTKPLSTFSAFEDEDSDEELAIRLIQSRHSDVDRFRFHGSMRIGGSPNLRRAMAHSASPGMQVRHTSGLIV